VRILKRLLLGALVLLLVLAVAILVLYLKNRPSPPPSLGLGPKPATLAAAYRQFVAIERMPEHEGALRDFPDFKVKEAHARDMLSLAHELPESRVVDAVQLVLDAAPQVYEMERLAVRARATTDKLLAMPSDLSQQYHIRQTGARAEDHATQLNIRARQEVAGLEELLRYAERELNIVVDGGATEVAARNWVDARARDSDGKASAVPVPTDSDFTYRPEPRFRVNSIRRSEVSRGWRVVREDGQQIGRKPANSLVIAWTAGLPRQLYLSDRTEQR